MFPAPGGGAVGFGSPRAQPGEVQVIGYLRQSQQAKSVLRYLRLLDKAP